MTKVIVTGDRYMYLDDKIREIKRQLRQKSGYPFDLDALDAALQRIVEGKFEGVAAERFSGRTIADMIADAGFRPNRVNPSINEQNFPLEKEGVYDASGLALFGGDREWSIAEVKAAVESAGGRLEGLVRGLAYLKTNSNALNDGSIVFNASNYWEFREHVNVPVAFMDSGEPRLYLRFVDRYDRWDRRDRFLISGKSGT